MALNVAINAVKAAGLDFPAGAGHSLSPNVLAVSNTSDTSSSSGTSNATSTPTVNLFFDAVTSGFGYAASVVSVDCSNTIYAVVCTSAPDDIAEYATACGTDAGTITVTEGPSEYIGRSTVVTSTLGVEVTVAISESCALTGTTEASCTATISGSAQGTSTVISTSEVLSGSSYYRFDVPITGGAEKTAAATGTCQSGASTVGTKAAAVWGLVGALGVASLLSM